MDPLTPNAVNLGLLTLRVVFGVVFASHGYAKFFTGGRIAGTAGWFDGMGMRPGRVHAVMAASTEIASGVLLALGLLTPFAGAAMVGVMVVAGYTAHRGKGFFIVKGGWEYTFMLAVLGIGIATTGPGRWSLDRAIFDEPSAFGLDGVKGLLVAALGGGLAGVGQMLAFYRPPMS